MVELSPESFQPIEFDSHAGPRAPNQEAKGGTTTSNHPLETQSIYAMNRIAIGSFYIYILYAPLKYFHMILAAYILLGLFEYPRSIISTHI